MCISVPRHTGLSEKSPACEGRAGVDVGRPTCHRGRETMVELARQAAGGSLALVTLPNIIHQTDTHSSYPKIIIIFFTIFFHNFVLKLVYTMQRKSLRR